MSINNTAPFFFIRTERRYVRVHFDEIIYVESCGNFVNIYTDRGKYMALISVKQLESLLPEERFVRVHRSCIVALERIVSFEKDIITLENAIIPMGVKFRMGFLRSVTIVQREKCRERSA